MAAERILDGLNAAQREAVTHDAGPLLIVAGAGTGKTTAITRRIAYLIAQRRARPEEILALTFTDKAAAEMEERVDTLVPYGYADVEIATFHAFGDRLLREHALEVGLTPDFRVLTRAEQVIFFRDRLFEFPLARYRPLGDPTRYLQAIISLISRCKDEDISPDAFRACADRLLAETAARPEDETLRDRAAQQDELAGTYARYQELMARQGAVDFGDQIVHALRLMRARPHVLGAAQRRFRYILVDEFQDTNYAQFELVKLLAARHRNVVVVADDDQCLPAGTMVAMPGGARPIETVREGDEVLTAIGDGRAGTSTVTRTFRQTVATLFRTFETASGRRVTTTANHKMFCYVPQGGKVQRGGPSRAKVVVTMCDRRQASSTGNRSRRAAQILHAVRLETSAPEVADRLRAAGIPVTRARRGWYVRMSSAELKDVGSLAELLRELTDAVLEVRLAVGRTGDTSRPALVMPAANVAAGHHLPVRRGSRIVYERIVRITEEMRREPVYDLEVARTHNFVADDVVVHNSIYKWRGAAISNVLGFLGHYPGARQIVLSENFRSHQEILDASYRLIVHNNPDRLEVRHGINKHLTAVRETGGRPPAHLHYETATQEADAVAQMIADRVEQGVWSYDDAAILVRSNDDADPFLRSLNLRGVPWTFSGNAGLYGRPEVRLLLAFLRAVAHPDDSVSVHYLASSDIYQVPIVDLTRCATYADRRHRWLFDVLRAAAELPDLGEEIEAEGQAAIAHLVADLVRYMELGREMPTGELLYQFLVDSGWLARMSKATSARDEAEVQNVSKFFRRVQDASRALRYDNVREFVKHLDALIEAGEDPAVAEADVETPAVHVLTVHKAKGLEFPVVFLVHLVQEKFPLRRRREQLEVPPELVKDILPTGDFHMQEERRLFYVGMTRARRELYLTSARDYGGARQRKVSQFVLEALDLPRDAARPFRARAVQEIERYAPPAEREGDEAAGPAPDEELLLSHKQVDDYETCPLKYRYVHILRVPILRHHTVVYGSTVHRVVETYLRRRVAGNYTSLDDMLAMYEREWENQGFLTWEHQEARKAAGREALTRFWHAEEAEGIKPTHVEKEFGFALGADRVRGRFDRVDEDLFGATIVDYKTSEVTRQKDADRRAAESLQLKIYALAWREMTGGTLPQRVELRFIESQVVGRHTPTAADVTAAVDAVKAAAAGIRARRFEATPSYSACRFCAYSQICPYTATRE